MIALTVAVIVLIIITSMLVYYSTDAMDTKKLSNLYNDIEQLNDKIQIYYLQNGELPVLNEFSSIEAIEPDKNVNDSEKYYVINLSQLPNILLNYGRDFETIKSNWQNENYDETLYKDVYIINEQTMQIYYVQGVKVDRETYYTKNLEYNNISSKVTKISSIEDLVRFSQSVNSGNTYEGQYVFLTRNLNFESSISYDGSEVTIGTKKYSYGGANNLVAYLTTGTNGFTLIGTSTNPFLGTFDGKGFIIENVYVNGTPNNNIFTDSNVNAKNLIIK